MVDRLGVSGFAGGPRAELASFPGSHAQLQCSSSGAWEPGNEARPTRITSRLRTEDWDAGNEARLTLLSKKERQSSGNHPSDRLTSKFSLLFQAMVGLDLCVRELLVLSCSVASL